MLTVCASVFQSGFVQTAPFVQTTPFVQTIGFLQTFRWANCQNAVYRTVPLLACPAVRCSVPLLACPAVQCCEQMIKTILRRIIRARCVRVVGRSGGPRSVVAVFPLLADATAARDSTYLILANAS